MDTKERARQMAVALDAHGYLTVHDEAACIDLFQRQLDEARASGRAAGLTEAVQIIPSYPNPRYSGLVGFSADMRETISKRAESVLAGITAPSPVAEKGSR